MGKLAPSLLPIAAEQIMSRSSPVWRLRHAGAVDMTSSRGGTESREYVARRHTSNARAADARPYRPPTGLLPGRRTNTDAA